MGATEPANIRLLVLDVDGVLTDGRIHMGPDGAETKVFNVRDGWGIKLWRNSGRRVAIISGRASPAVGRRAFELGVDTLRQGADDKLPAYQSVLKEMGLSAEQADVMGDDLPDLPLLRSCGYSLAPCDAVEEVRAVARHVTALGGGAGCVRAAIEHLLKLSGEWESLTRPLRGPGGGA